MQPLFPGASYNALQHSPQQLLLGLKGSILAKTGEFLVAPIIGID
jgi:hypothetical protein